MQLQFFFFLGIMLYKCMNRMDVLGMNRQFINKRKACLFSRMFWMTGTFFFRRMISLRMQLLSISSDTSKAELLCRSWFTKCTLRRNLKCHKKTPNFGTKFHLDCGHRIFSHGSFKKSFGLCNKPWPIHEKVCKLFDTFFRGDIGKWLFVVNAVCCTNCWLNYNVFN